MMTTVPRGRRARIGFDSFAEITDVAVVSIDKDAVVFAADLSEQEAADVWALLESIDDTDMVKRENIRALRDADPFDCEALAIALANYVLGETP